LQDAERGHEKAMDDLRRVAADFDNYRKRDAREQTQILARSGERVVAKVIPADGPFDPHVHEALMATPVEGVEPGDVVQVVQRGYRIGDAVLRPARVVVAEERGEE